jgi:hypothetical protein
MDRWCSGNTWRWLVRHRSCSSLTAQSNTRNLGSDNPQAIEITKELTMIIRVAFVVAAMASICAVMPAGAEDAKLGVGITVGSGHDDRDRNKTVVIKKDRDHDRDDRKVVIKKDRDHDGDVDKKVVIKKDHDHD